MDAVFQDIRTERDRQDVTWGAARTQSADVWMAILTEEVLEVLQQQAARRYGQTALRTELVQVAAVAVAWVEAIDRE